MNKEVFIEQDGTIDSDIIVKELERRGANNFYNISCIGKGKLYTISPNPLNAIIEVDTCPYTYIKLVFNGSGFQEVLPKVIFQDGYLPVIYYV